MLGGISMNEKKIRYVEQKACRLIKKELGIEINYLNIELNPKSSEYENELKCFRLLFVQTNSDYKLALWNGLCFVSRNIEKSDFNEEELAYLEKRIAAQENLRFPYSENVNKPFNSKRLKFRIPEDNDLKIYHQHLKSDGDFSMFTCINCNRKNIKKFNFERPFCYTIVEKKSNNMIGYVAMIWDKFEHDKAKITRLEYYIFKPYRNNGYAKETILAFLDKAFSGCLLELVETNYSRIYKNRKAKIELVRAQIRNDNIPSRRLVESCGFIHTGTLRRDFVVEDKYCVDKEIYEITKEEFYEIYNKNSP